MNKLSILTTLAFFAFGASGYFNSQKAWYISAACLFVLLYITYFIESDLKLFELNAKKFLQTDGVIFLFCFLLMLFCLTWCLYISFYSHVTGANHSLLIGVLFGIVCVALGGLFFYLCMKEDNFDNMEPYILISISSGLLLLLHLVKVYKVKSIFQHQIHDWVLAILIAIPAIELLCINYRAIATVLCYRIKHTSSLLYVRVFAPDNSSSNGKGDESGYSPSNGNGDESGSSSSDDEVGAPGYSSSDGNGDESGSSSSDDEGGAPGNSSLYGNGDESDSSLSYDEVVLERASIGRGD